MTIEKIMEYILRSPYNVNGNILIPMLKQLEAGGGDPEEIKEEVYGEILEETYGTEEEPEEVEIIDNGK